jgi:hypothetical protein
VVATFSITAANSCLTNGSKGDSVKQGKSQRFCRCRLALSWLGHLVNVQSKEGHRKAAEQQQEVLGSEGHDSRCKTLLSNVTEAQRCVTNAFLGECSWGLHEPSFFMTYPFGATKTDLEKAFRLPDALVITEAQTQESVEMTESDLATVMLEHPGV